MKDIPIESLHRHLGARPLENGHSTFRVWSPTSQSVQVQRESDGSRYPLNPEPAGHHAAVLPQFKAGDRYRIIFDDGSPMPDPASRYQPDGVHGPSEIVDSTFAWTDLDWTGVQPKNWVIYELHVGAFTDAGTFLAAIDRLDELSQLGITAIELMPVADAAGRWNWGYDGVNLFAPNRNYGTPDDFRRLIDAAHAKGIAVFLDVVYNHLGPEGNYLGASGPYLSTRHHTVWGSAPNFDDPEHGQECRRFFIANAIYWLDEFHLDGLRIDAIHCMKDDRPEHVVVEMSRAVASWRRQSGRRAVLIAESNVYDADMLKPIKDGGCGFDAQWSDDFVHSVLASLRPGEQLCHRSYQPATDLDQVLRMGYVYSGTLQGNRGREHVTQPVSTEGLIRCIQNHDFIGNHPLGQRLTELTSPSAHRAAATLMMLLPSVPMIFMGEEFACDRPFGFFVDFGDDFLRQSVIEGRRREYPQHDWSNGILPTDQSAFMHSKIGPIRDQSMWDFYRTLIQLRKSWLENGILSDHFMSVDNDVESGVYRIRYQQGSMAAGMSVCLRPEGQFNRCESQSAGQPETELPAMGLGQQCDILVDTRSLDPMAATWALVWQMSVTSKSR
jgi:maltooligosyltrehalose trehalohydrolase